jgi:hypothetical protein
VFRIGLNGFGCIEPEGRHLFIETTYHIASAEKILDLENLRTLIIVELKHSRDEEVSIWGGDTAEEERHDLAMGKLFEVMFRKMRKLRVLMVSVIKAPQRNVVLSVPGSLGQMKHLRLLQFYYTTVYPGKIIFPSTFTKLYNMQILEFTTIISNTKIFFPEDTANKLIHLRRLHGVVLYMPNVGRLASLQLMPQFFVRKRQGYELKQLKHLTQPSGYFVPPSS